MAEQRRTHSTEIIPKKIQNMLLHSSHSEIFFRTCSILPCQILEERKGNAKGTLIVKNAFRVELLLSGTVGSGASDLLLCTYSIWEEILPDKSMQNACEEEAIPLYNVIFKKMYLMHLRTCCLFDC